MKLTFLKTPKDVVRNDSDTLGEDPEEHFTFEDKMPLEIPEVMQKVLSSMKPGSEECSYVWGLYDDRRFQEYREHFSKLHTEYRKREAVEGKQAKAEADLVEIKQEAWRVLQELPERLRKRARGRISKKVAEQLERNPRDVQRLLMPWFDSLGV